MTVTKRKINIRKIKFHRTFLLFRATYIVGEINIVNIKKLK